MSRRRPTKKRTCGGKRRFRDDEEARAAIRGFVNYSGRDTIPVRFYHCDFCNGVHLTSQPQRTRRAAA